MSITNDWFFEKFQKPELKVPRVVNKTTRTGPKRNIIEGTILGVVLTVLSYYVGLKAGWTNHVDLLEAFAVFTSYVCTYLCVTERRINYPIGAVSTAAYAILFIKAGLVASAILNIYLTPALVYGWFRWKRDADTRPVTRVAWKWIPVYLGVSVAMYFGAVWLVGVFGGTLALTDSIILVGSILAQFLLDNKKIENWYVWMIVNGFAIYTYFHAKLFIAALQYVFFLGNTFYGIYVWNRGKTNAQSMDTIDSAAPNQGPLALNPVHV